MNVPDAAPPVVSAPRWGRAIGGSVVVLAVLVGLALLWVATKPMPSYATGPGRVVVTATDYAFAPRSTTWRVGERVTLTLENESDANPGKGHEFMMGRRPVMGASMFGPRPIGGYETDFFDGVAVKVLRAKGLSMLMPGKAKVAERDIETFVMSGMPGMEMGGGGGGMQMGGMEMEGDQGFMLMLEPGGSVTISFVVPAKRGRWEFGCFQQSGEHYTNGMKGAIAVDRA
jgi:uncharacterized cupredoxin-like copper-binding protein